MQQYPTQRRQSELRPQYQQQQLMPPQQSMNMNNNTNKNNNNHPNPAAAPRHVAMGPADMLSAPPAQLPPLAAGNGQNLRRGMNGMNNGGGGFPQGGANNGYDRVGRGGGDGFRPGHVVTGGLGISHGLRCTRVHAACWAGIWLFTFVISMLLYTIYDRTNHDGDGEWRLLWILIVFGWLCSAIFAVVVVCALMRHSDADGGGDDQCTCADCGGCGDMNCECGSVECGECDCLNRDAW
jgi:hypothetical protein